ncbi:MAG: transposase [Nocardioidaceae bacterium]|nr:transposase [Nocardioidaceae bacterium]
MATVARDTNGRRLYTAEFKRQQVERIERGEVTASELSRELGIARSLLQRWKHLVTRAGETAVGANEEVVPVSALRTAEQRIRELERDYVGGADLSSAAAVLEQLPRWIADYNGAAPHSALGYLPPLEYRRRRQEIVTD